MILPGARDSPLGNSIRPRGERTGALGPSREAVSPLIHPALSTDVQGDKLSYLGELRLGAMDSQKAQELFKRYAPCMAYIAVTDAGAKENIGTAFHVGEGVFVTARHVVENAIINEVKATETHRRPLKEVIPEYRDHEIAEIAKTIAQTPTWPVFQNPLRIIKGPFFH